MKRPMPKTDLTVDDARSKLAGWHFMQEQLSSSEREILYVAEAVLRELDLRDVLSPRDPGQVAGSQKAVAWLETLRSAIVVRDATDYRTPDYERCIHEILGLCKYQYVDHALAMVRR